MIVWSPLFFLGPRAFAWWIVRFWARSHLWLMKVIVGTDHVVRGREKLPRGGYIIAPKHQSAWDTIAFLPWWPDPVYILKRELMWIPLFGWYIARMNMIAIDRGNREKAIRAINARARQMIDDGRQIIIYPEGTRRPPGAEPAYKSGIAHLYETLGVPVVPIAHNAGLYWPRRGFMRYRGLIEVEVLDPIEPGLSRARFMEELVTRTETACDRLLARAASAPDAPPMPKTARERLSAMDRTVKPAEA
ncbi:MULTISPECIES: 1-acyl-sn-glycerol-3-phosphate acyltransferase [unclassified Roseitalea]|uniref:lysophospholipid acyltransferase family protein n=1 Tax=unclassified Roseitalea TaxID=2639107 RepID=UPI00273E8E8D|nr:MULTISPECIES: 1-acyl-sn-glycerol-3-phosphate acyltransferase [unclassified Roseitalea]